MKAFFAVLLVGTVLGELVLQDSLIEEVNAKNAGWTAGRNKYFEGKTKDEVRRMLGFVKDDSLRLPEFVPQATTSVPDSFDSAKNWPNCSTIGKILDQGECGSCWAFGATESISDRFCIASKGAVNFQLSEQQMTSCGPGDGCEGGDAGSAFMYARSHGLLPSYAYPYKQPTCAPTAQPCMPSTFKPTLPCRIPSGTVYKLSEVHTAFGAKRMQEYIFESGPIEVCFTVYEDFVHYKSGVYRHTTGGALGGHCVKAVGWGTENGEDYWIINNSWTTTWGDNGQFKILRGHDECGIERDAVGGTPLLN